MINNQHEIKIKQTVELVNVPMLYIDNKLIIKYANQAAYKEFNFKKDTLENLDLKKMLANNNANINKNMIQEFKKVLKHGETIHDEHEIFMPTLLDGSQIYFTVKSPVYSEDGQINGVFATFVNITSDKLNQELKIMEEQKKAMHLQQREFKEYIEQFIYGMQYSALKLMQSRLNIDLKAHDSNDLTTKQYQILNLLSQGKSSDEIAKEFSGDFSKDSITLNIISIVNNVLSKLGATWESENQYMIN